MDTLQFPTYSKWEWFLAGTRFGADYKAKKYIKTILDERNDRDVSHEWAKLPEPEQTIGRELNRLISERLHWTPPSRFIPADALAVVLWDTYDGFNVVELLTELDERYHVDTMKFLERVYPNEQIDSDVTFCEFIQYLVQEGDALMVRKVCIIANK
jgi:hypothetical protein